MKTIFAALLVLTGVGIVTMCAPVTYDNNIQRAINKDTAPTRVERIEAYHNSLAKYGYAMWTEVDTVRIGEFVNDDIIKETVIIR